MQDENTEIDTENKGNYVSELFQKAFKSCGLWDSRTLKSAQEWVREELGKAKTVRDGISLFRVENSKGITSFRELDPQIRYNVVSHSIILDLSNHGDFHMDYDENPYYFRYDDNCLYEITSKVSGNDTIIPLLATDYGVNYTTAEGKYVLEALRTHTISQGDIYPIYKGFYFDNIKNRLLISDRWDQYLILDGDSIQPVPNGTDCIFFQSLSRRVGNSPISYTIPVGRGKERPSSPIRSILIDRIGFSDEGALSVEEQRILLELYVHSIPYGSILKTKPILTFLGEKGSGKSTALRSLGKFLLGPSYQILGIPDESSYHVVAEDNLLFFIDNVDKPQKWLQDALATTSTGITHEKRKLYTDKDIVKLTPHGFQGVTLRGIQYIQGDVIDRMLIFRVKRFEYFRPEESLEKDLKIHMDEMWNEYLEKQNKIVKKLADTPIENATTTHRMADWAILAQTIGEALGSSPKVVDAVLAKLDHEKAELVLQDDPLPVAVNWYTQSPHNEEAWIPTAALHALFQGRPGYCNKYRSPISLGKRLRSIRSELERYFGMECRKNPTTKTWEYRFPRQEQLNKDCEVEI